MNHNRKNVFTVSLNPNLGETPELLMTAIAMAIFDQASPLSDPDDPSAVPDLRYSKDDVLTEEEANRFVHNDREVSMLFVKGRMCVAHVFAARLTPTEAEIALPMYDLDGEKLFDRVSDRLDQLVAAHAADGIDVDVELDILDLEDVIDDEEPTLRLALPAIA